MLQFNWSLAWHRLVAFTEPFAVRRRPNSLDHDSAKESPISSRFSCALTLSASILLWVLIEFLFAVLTAKVIGLPSMLRRARGILSVNLHAAYRISLIIWHCYPLSCCVLTAMVGTECA